MQTSYLRAGILSLRKHLKKDGTPASRFRDGNTEVVLNRSRKSMLQQYGPRRRELVPLCKQLLAAVVPTTSTGTPTSVESTPMWICPLCGGPMIVIERLTAGQQTAQNIGPAF
jgi:hypothetical protein